MINAPTTSIELGRGSMVRRTSTRAGAGRTILFGAFAACLLALPALTTTPAAAQTGQSVPAATAWQERLAALTPADPAAYLELGEEIAATITEPQSGAPAESAAATRRLVVELYVLALALDQRDTGISPTGASAALALASISIRDEEKRWLTAVARTLDPRQAPPPWMARPEVASVESEAFRAASAIGLIRSGDGIRARQLLGHAEVRAVLERSSSLIERLGFSGGAGRLLREAELWPCSQCANQRIFKRLTASGEPRLCTNCEGVPGPRLSERELLALLQFESWLLDGRQRSWAAQSTADGGAPLRDPDPTEVSSFFRVDPKRPYWRRGAWRSNADGTDAAPSPPPAATTPPGDTPQPPPSGG